MTPRLYTFTQLAAELKAEDPDTPITVKTLRRFHVNGMRAIQVGRTYYMHREAYDEFIREHEKAEYTPYRKPAEGQEAI